MEFVARGKRPLYRRAAARACVVRPGTLVAVIVRAGRVIVPFGDDHIEDGGQRGCCHRLRERHWRPERGYPSNEQTTGRVIIAGRDAAGGGGGHAALALLVALVYRGSGRWRWRWLKVHPGAGGGGAAAALLAVSRGSVTLRAREGFVVVALAWVGLSGFGALPFVFSGDLPNYE